MFPGGYGTDFGQKIVEKTMKNHDFLNFSLLDFAIFPRIPVGVATAVAVAAPWPTVGLVAALTNGFRA